MDDVLKQVEELLEKVSVAGEENWRRMALAKETLRKLRGQIQKVAAQQKKEETEHGTGTDAVCTGEQEADTDAV